MPFDFFDKIYCINLDERKDRWEQVNAEFESVGLADKVERLSAVKIENRKKACKLSHTKCVEQAFDAGLENVLIFEDDVRFIHTDIGPLREAIKKLSQIKNWELFYLGGRPVRPAAFASRHLIECSFWGNHAYAVHKRAWPYFEEMNSSPTHKDVWFAEHVKESYGLYPAMATQAPGYSDIKRDFLDNKTQIYKEHYEKFVEPRAFHRFWLKLKHTFCAR